jgi:hypothetical protein
MGFARGVKMSHEERGTWINAVVAACAFGYYLTWIISQARNTPITEIAYIPTMLWVIAFAIVASIVGQILAAIGSSKEANKKDQRDREIYQYGAHIGHGFLVLGAVAAMGLSMVKADHFWIANVIYTAFVLSELTSALAKLIAYRTGF